MVNFKTHPDHYKYSELGITVVHLNVTSFGANGEIKFQHSYNPDRNDQKREQ